MGGGGGQRMRNMEQWPTGCGLMCGQGYGTLRGRGPTAPHPTPHVWGVRSTGFRIEGMMVRGA